MSEDKSFIYARTEFLDKIFGPDDDNMIGLLQKFSRLGFDTNLFIDRTNTITGPIRTTNIFPIPKFDATFNKSITEVCENAARDILNEGKPIDIFWSGGVDSTAIVVSFLNVCKDLSQIRIMHEMRSIDEYPLFYNKYIKNMNPVLLETYISKHLQLDDHIIVTGEGGGTIIGQWRIIQTKLTEFGFSNIDSFMPWEDVFKTDVSIFENKDQDLYFVDTIRAQLKKAPFKIETIRDLYWWLGFSMKWSGETFMRLGWVEVITDAKLNNYKPFFMTDEFQKWGMWNYCNNLRYIAPNLDDKKVVYKTDYKKVIYDFTKDEEYFNNKMNMPSGPWLSEKGRVGPPYMSAIDNEYTVYNSAVTDVWEDEFINTNYQSMVKKNLPD